MTFDYENSAQWIARRMLGDDPVADIPAELKPGSEEEGYAVQEIVAARLAEDRGRVVGYKIGITTPGMRAHLGIDHPLFGTMHERGSVANGAQVAVANFTRIGIECEIAVRLARPLAGPPPPLDTIADWIDELYPAIELVDDRYGGDYPAIGVPTIVASSVFHHGFVLGKPVADWRALDLNKVIGITRANGVEQVRGLGSDVMGHPLASLQWLAKRGGDLDPWSRTADYWDDGHVARPLWAKEGAIVLLGSLPIPYWAKAGEKIEIELSGLGKASIDLI